MSGKQARNRRVSPPHLVTMRTLARLLRPLQNRHESWGEKLNLIHENVRRAGATAAIASLAAVARGADELFRAAAI